MKAVRNTENGIDVLDVPSPKGDGVVINIRSAGICGSDLSAVQHGHLFPYTMGHELAGYCEDGRAVAIEPVIPCGDCDQCHSQNYNRCRAQFDTFVAFSCDGGMAEQIRLPERCLVPLPAGLDVRDGCLVEPIAVAIHGLRLGNVMAGQRVAIVGGGSIGQVCVAAAVSRGAEVALKSRHPAQALAGERLGARPVEGGDYDVVFECAGGSESAIDESVSLLRPGGKLLLMSVNIDRVSLPGMDLLFKEIQVLPSMSYSRHTGGRDVDSAAALLAANPHIAQAIISHRFPLADAREAFRVAQDRSAGAIKVVLEP